MSTLEELIAKKNEYDTALKEFGQTSLQELFQAFFAENEWCDAVAWVQYTPYFNDGEECIFGVYDPQFRPTEEFAVEKGLDLEGDSDWGFTGFFSGFQSYQRVEGSGRKVENTWRKGTYTTKYDYEYVDFFEGAKELEEKIENFTRIFGDGAIEPIFKAAFGDHVKVIATRNGFDVEEYHHD